MAKRLLLLAGALTIALVAFGGVYWLTSDTAGPRTSAPPPADIAPAGDTQISGITAPGGLKIYETDNPVIIGPRDLKDNHIPYKFGFERRGKSDSGELVIVRPWARFYDRSGQVIQITADEAIVPITESGGETEIPQNGNLKGNVIIQMFASIDSDSEPPLPYEAKPGDLPPAQLTVELDEVVFDREHSSLSSDGPLNIESAEMILHGRGLERLIYDQVNRRVQDLEIRHVEELLIAAELLEKQDNDSSAAKADNTASPTPSALTTDSEKANSEELINYQLVLNRNIHVVSANESMMADRIEIKVNALVLENNKSSGEENLVAKKEIIDNPLTNTAIPATEPEWIRVTAEGPLVITSELSSGPAWPRMSLRADGSPVEVFQDNQLVASAPTFMIVDEKENHLRTLDMLATAAQPVFMVLSESEQLHETQGLSMNQHSGQATLSGPGRITSLAPASGDNDKLPEDVATTIDYQGPVHLSFASPKSLSLTSLPPIEQFDVIGGLTITGPNGTLIASGGKASFYPLLINTDSNDKPDVKEKKSTKTPPCIKTLELTELKTIGSETTSPLKLNTGKLTLHFALPSIDADKSGNVQKSWIQTAYLKDGVDYNDPNLAIKTDDAVVLTFPEPSMQNGKILDASPDGGFNNILNVIIANDPNYIRITSKNKPMTVSFKKDGYRISGTEAFGNPTTETLTVLGDPATIISTEPNVPWRTLQGPKIVADSPNKTFTVIGAGQLALQTTTDFTGRKLDKSVPIEIAWKKEAAFFDETNVIRLYDVTATMLDESDQGGRQETTLTCTELTVWLLESPINTSNNSTLAHNSTKAKNQFGHLTAFGPEVTMVMKEFDGTGALVRQSRMQLAQLDYAGDIMAGIGPGWMEVYNKANAGRDDKKKKVDMASLVSGSFSQNEENYSLLTFKSSVTFDQATKEASFYDDVTIDHVPLSEVVMPITAKNLKNYEGRISLTAQTMTFTIVDNIQDKHMPKDETITLLVNKLSAQGNIFCEIIRSPLPYVFTGGFASYDNQTGRLVLTGSRSQPVRFNDTHFRQISYGIYSRELDALPLDAAASF